MTAKNTKRVRRDQEKRRERDNKIKILNEENKDLKNKVRSLNNVIKHTPNPDRKKKQREPKRKQEVCPACGEDNMRTINLTRLDGKLLIVSCECGYRSAKKLLV